jgi:hypothetical protein
MLLTPFLKQTWRCLFNNRRKTRFSGKKASRRSMRQFPIMPDDVFWKHSVRLGRYG